ncbi:DUF4129 domain-containing protein [Halorarius litoreus]|uniref:DUF4129 domain-containing protein n=1 Tax=Halorarius litoreus TaxID=2962676 RepID=UPI0020CF3B42|nr:DUF4129 domain-containing protein [Halorarius litoreus]
MNRDSYLTVLLAVCCIGAAGMASTTLASSLSEDPDDVVDVDYSKLPIGKDEGNSVRGAVQNEEGTPPEGGSDSEDRTDPQGSTGGGDSDRSESSAPDEQSSGDDGAESSDSQSADGSGGGETGESGSGGGTGTSGVGAGGSGSGRGPGTPAVNWLWNLLEQLLPFLVLLVAAALAYRYRRNLLALALALAAAFGDRTPDRDRTATRWPAERPSNDVHRAWVSMVDRLDLDQPHTRTPSECASAAVEANMDPSAVQTLTDVFEEVRYGEKPVTDERRQRAKRGLDRLRGGETR